MIALTGSSRPAVVAARLSPLRVPHDFYATPPEGTRALLSIEQFDGPVWEPACGTGHIARVLSEAGHNVIATDLVDRGYGAGGIDFLQQRVARGKHIVTNPPYGRGLADRFIVHALKLTATTGGSVAMLCDLASLCHPLRHPLFRATPPAKVYALDELVCLPNGEAERQQFMARAGRRYCWLVWHPRHDGPTMLGWLSTAPFRDR